MMNRTAEHIEKIRKIMNTNETIQNMMTILANRAVEKNLTKEEWETFKVNMMTAMFYKMAEKMPELKQDLCEDIYEALRA